MAHRTHPKCEGGSVVDALLSKVLEYLLKRCLADSIFCDSDLLSLSLNSTEKIADGLVFFGYSDFVEITALLQQFYVFKLLGKELDELESMLLRVKELDEALKTNRVIRVNLFFHYKINSEPCLGDLFKYKGIESSI